MGNKPIKLKDSIIIDRLIIDCFKDSDLEIPVVEINKLKVHFREGEIFFNFKFDYLIYYNNKIFHDGLPSLYDNYIAKVEQFSSQNKKSEKIFTIFIDFEQDFNFEEDELEFEPIFTIVFEKLEIKNIQCFYLYYCEIEYLQAFFEQLYENVYLYKDSRNYESLYFLLPNKDYFIKNEDYLLYLKSRDKYDQVKDYYINNFKTAYNEIIFNTNYFKKFLSLKSSQNYCSVKINTFLENIPECLFIKYIAEINLDDEDKLNFINQQKRFCDFHKLLCSKASNLQIIFIIKNALNNDNIHNLTNLMKFIITNFNNSQKNYFLHVIKIIYIGNIMNDNNILYNKKNINNVNNANNEINKDNSFINLDKFIQMLLNLSFSKEHKKSRKLIIDYYNVYKITFPEGASKNSKKKIDTLTKNNSEIFINNLDEEGMEDNDIKENTDYYYDKEKLSYEWFIKDNIIKKIMVNILFILDSKLNVNNILFNKLNKNKNKDDAYLKKDIITKIKKNIFSYIFPDKFSKYFYSQYTEHRDLKNVETSFEKIMFV
jgi:hypothetical protein